MKKLHLLILTGSLAAGLNAAVVFDDSFADGNPANTGAGQTAWYKTTGSGALEAALGSLGLVTGTSGNALHTTFATQTLSSIGDILTITATYTTPATILTLGSASTAGSNGFRVGLFNDGGTSFAKDFTTSTDASWASTTGYVLCLDVNKPDTSDNVTFYEVGAGGNTTRLISSTTTWTYGSNNVSNNYSMAPNTTYTVEMSIERTGVSALTLSASLKQEASTLASHSYAALSVTTDAFNIASLFATSNVFGSTNVVGAPDNGVDFSNITLTSSVPEPAAFAAVLALLALGFAGIRRRRQPA